MHCIPLLLHGRPCRHGIPRPIDGRPLKHGVQRRRLRIGRGRRRLLKLSRGTMHTATHPTAAHGHGRRCRWFAWWRGGERIGHSKRIDVASRRSKRVRFRRGGYSGAAKAISGAPSKRGFPSRGALQVGPSRRRRERRGHW